MYIFSNNGGVSTVITAYDLSAAVIVKEVVLSVTKT